MTAKPSASASPDRASSSHHLHKEHWLLAALFLLAVAARLAYTGLFVGFDSPPEHDGISYHLLASNLVNGYGYVLPEPTAFRPPGYPLLLAGLYALVGERLDLVRALQAGLGGILTLLTYATGVALFRSRSVGVLAGLGVALHPILVYLSGAILTESVFVTLVMAVIWLMVVSRAVLTPRSVLALALLLGLLVLIRPSALIFAGLVALWSVFTPQRRSRGFLYAIAVAAGVAVFILPWTIRNAIQFHEFIPSATEGGVTFWSGNNALAAGGVVEPSTATWPDSDPPAGLHGWPELSEKESDERFYASALAWIKSHPRDFIVLLPKKLARAWTLTYGNEARTDSLPDWIPTIYLLFPLAALAGLTLSLHAWRRLMPIYLLVAAFTMTTLAFYGSARQSAVLFPSAAILAAYAVVSTYRFIRSRNDSQDRGNPS